MVATRSMSKTLLGHCIYINGHEMDLIKETNTMVVHNPESNMGNACGCPPTMELVHRGILTGLGTEMQEVRSMPLSLVF